MSDDAPLGDWWPVTDESIPFESYEEVKQRLEWELVLERLLPEGRMG